MHIETQAKSSVCPMTVKKTCESLGRQRIDSIQERLTGFRFDSRAIFTNSERFDSKIKFDSIGLTILHSLSAFTGFIKCLVRGQITPQL